MVGLNTKLLKVRYSQVSLFSCLLFRSQVFNFFLIFFSALYHHNGANSSGRSSNCDDGDMQSDISIEEDVIDLNQKVIQSFFSIDRLIQITILFMSIFIPSKGNAILPNKKLLKILSRVLVLGSAESERQN